MHPRYAVANAVQTEQFAITLRSGTSPDELVDVVASLVRAREDQFEWVAPADLKTREAPADAH